MIRIKTPEEIKILKEGGKILAGIVKELSEMAKPGVTTGDLENLAVKRIKEAGGRPVFKGLEMPDGEVFPTALCTSINDEVVHAPATPARVLNNGDIIGIDVGMEYPVKTPAKPVNNLSVLGGYYTDMCVTAVVGEVDKNINSLVEAARSALEAGIKEIRPGNTLNDIGTAIQKYTESRGYSVVRDLVGHGVGHEMHEAPQIPNYEIKGSGLEDVVLKTGMVLAIEPMINMGEYGVEVAADGLTFVTRDGSLSAQFEHTVAVTESGYEILTLP